MENNLFPQELFEETDDLTSSLPDTFSNSLFPEELFEENDLPAAPTVIPPAVSQPFPADTLPVEPVNDPAFGSNPMAQPAANPFQKAINNFNVQEAERLTGQQQVDPVQPIPYNPKPLATLVRENAIASQGPTQEYPSVFYPPEPQSLTPAEVETSRLAELFQQAGPLQAKVNANLNPSLSGISGVPGNFTTAQGEVQVPDGSAAEIIGKANVTELSNNAVNRGFGRLAKTANILSQQAGLKNTPAFVKKMQELERIYPDAPPEIQAGLKEITDAKGVYNTIMSIASNPSAVLSVVGESLPSSIPALLALPWAGPVAGAGIMGLSSGANEFAVVMDEEIKASGVDINDDAALIELMGNPEFLSKARERGITRGIPIAIFDALSVGIAGRLLSPAIASGSRLKTGAALGGELFGQSALGGLGEFGAQAAEIQRGFKDRYNLGEIGLEAVAEIVPGSVETAIQTKSALPQARDNRMRKEFEAELEAAQAEADDQAATDIAIDLLSPNSEFYQPSLGQQIYDLSARAEAAGQPGFAKAMRLNLRKLENIKPENLTFYKQKISEFESQSDGTEAVIERDENVFEGTLLGAAKKPEDAKKKFDAAMNDPRTGPVLKEMQEAMQALGDRLHELGYNWKEIRNSGSVSPEIKEARSFMSRMGSASRLINQTNANLKGYQGQSSVSDEKLQEQINRVKQILAGPIPLLQTDQPAAPEVDTQEAKLPEAVTPIDNPEVAPPAAITPPELPSAKPVLPEPTPVPEVQSTAPEQPADLSSIPTQIVVGDTAGRIGLKVVDSFGASLRPNDDVESLDVRGTSGGSFTNLQGKKYGTINDVPYGEPVGRLINNKDGTITIQVGSRIDGKGSGAARDNYVSAAITLPANSTQDQQNAANREVLKNWKSNYEGITSSSQLKANAAKIVPREATPEKPPAVDQTPIERPEVQSTAPEQPTPPKIDEVSPQAPNDNPVGKDIGKPVVSVQTPDGQASYQVQGKVVELADLKKAEGKLQPRDRSRKDSEVLAKDRAGSKFNADRLLDDPTSGSGAPIIARDGTVMSGNGRVLTMQEVYSNQPKSLEAYKASLSAAGIDTAGFSQPVYVRQLSDDMTFDELKSFADLSNTEAQAQMSMTERASRDAERLVKSKIIDTFRGDYEIGAAQNRPFVTEYAKKILSPTEQGAFVKSDGSISAEGITRVRNALLASAFDNPDTLSIMLESPDDNIKAIGNAFMSTAPKFAQLKKQIADGRTDAQFDITPKLAEMANLISSLRSEGKKPKDFYNQDSMFDAPDPEVKELLRAFYNEELTTPNSKKAMKEFMDFYIDEALQKETGGLIPDDTTATDIIDQGRKRTEEARNAKKGTEQGGLFEASSNVQSDDAGGKQVQKRRNAQSSRKSQEVKSTAQAEINDTSRSNIESENVSEVSEVQEKFAFDPNEVQTSRVPPGKVMESQVDSTGQSLYNQAFTDAGIDPAKARNMPPARQFKILSDLVKDKFGFSYIAKSSENPYKSVQALLNAYRNLQWMTHSMSMPNKAIGLDGSLGLGLPSMQFGGYLAAYFPKQNNGMAIKTMSTLDSVVAPVIVMPKNSNSFAHEWAHALDFHIVDKLGYDWHNGGITGRTKTNLKGQPIFSDMAPTSLKEAMADLINVMFFDKADLAAQVMSLEQQIATSKAYELKTGKTTKKLPELEKRLKNLKQGSSRSSKVGPSGYKQGAERYGAATKGSGISPDYWTEPTEMFARAFEAYIAARVESSAQSQGMQGTTEFITKSNEAYAMTAAEVKGADLRLAETYPNQPDRDLIFTAFDRLMEAVSNDFLQGNPAAVPGDYDMLDAQGEFINATDSTNQPEAISAMEQQRRTFKKAKRDRQKQKLRPSEHKEGKSFLSSQAIKIENNILNEYIYTKKGSLFTLASRYKDNIQVKAIIEQLISKVATDPGSTENRVTTKDGTFEEGVQINGSRFSHKLVKIFNDYGIKEMSDAQLQELRQFLTGNENVQDAASPLIAAAAKDIREQILNPLYDYMQKNNYNVDYLADGSYFPRMMDTPLALQNKDEFLNGKNDNGTKGAFNLYSNVIYENEVGAFEEGDTEQVKNLIQIGKNKSVQEHMDEDLIDLVYDVDDIMTQIDGIQNEMETSDDADQLEVRLNQLLEELSEKHEQLHEELRVPYAKAASEEWYNRIDAQVGSDPERHAVQGIFAKKRKLPPEADDYMIDYYLDPIETLVQYIPAVVRKTEYHKRFGDHLVPKGKKQRVRGTMRPGMAPERVSYIEYILSEARKAGIQKNDAEHILFTINAITGMGTDYSGSQLNKVLNTVHTFGMMAMLPRAVLSSIAEPLTAGIQAQSTVAGFTAFQNTLDEALTSIRGKNAQDRKLYYQQLANILGVVDQPDVGEMVANRMGGTAQENPKLAAMTSRFFVRTLLQPLTNSQRRGSMRVGLKYLQEMASQYQKATTPNMKEQAREVLQDFGVRPNDMDGFTQWLSSQAHVPSVLERFRGKGSGVPDIDQIIEKNGQLTEYGSILAVAANRFTNQSIQNPNISERPKWAENPVGRLVYGIQSFMAAFSRNVLIHMAKRIQREYSKRGVLSGTVALGINNFLPIFSLVMGQTIVSTLREALFNPDKWAEEDAEGRLKRYLGLMGLSRAGVAGRFDPLFNALMSVRYEADLTNILVGPHLTYYMKAIQRTAAMFVRDNSPNTVSSEYQALRGVYDILIPTAGALLATAPGLGPQLGTMAGGAYAVATSPKVKHWVLREAIEGMTGVEYYPGSGGRKASSSSGFGGGGFGSGGFGD